MPQRTRPNSSTRLQASFLAISAALVAAFYVVMGILLLTFPQVFVGLSVMSCRLFGSLLVLYGVFRGYRAYKQWTARNSS